MKSGRFSSFVMIQIVFLLVILSLAVIPFSSQAAPDNSPQAVLQHAWELARQSGAYSFSTRLVQTTLPAPALANVGRGPRVETLYLEGETDLSTDLLLMRLWQEGGRLSDASQAVEVRVEAGSAYARQSEGAWQVIDNFANTLAPGNDLSAFLVAARNVQPGASSTLAGAQHYTFDLSGRALAEYLRLQLEDQLRQAGKLPPGLSLDAPQQFRSALGGGEVWVDAQGLPQRLAIDLQYPQEVNGERIQLEMVTDFSNFDRSVALADAASPDALTAFTRNLLQKTQQPENLLAISLLGFLMLIFLNARSKKVYAALVVVVILSMVLTPLLQSAQVAAFYQEQTAQQADYDQQLAEQDLGLQLQDEFLGNTWNPHLQPGAFTAHQLPAAEQLLPGLPASASPAPAQVTSDDDGDGLSNEDDPCPDTPDCDGDGLSDAQELRLGTDPEEMDTDGDYITDNAEVAGFWYNNQWWYSDPVNPDTNNDGQPDGSECSEKAVEEGELSPEDNPCEDRDTDGTPDIFDRDDDGDGVPDRVDLSPYKATYQEDGSPFDGEHPLLIQVDALQSDLPVFVDFQLRPEDEDHIWYALNVLDWPSGDEEGQIMRQRGNDTTFADLEDGSANASNGDMRLVPMLEIEIPYKEGHYANLPVLAGASNRTQDTNLDDWLDRQALADYGISVRAANDDGDLVAYVPLNLVEDETGGDRVAFGGRMYYWPTNAITETTTTDWGNTQQIRVVWLVQMLVDYVCTVEQEEQGECTEGQWVNDVPQVVRGYDESWYLTGLSVREDHGLEIAIAYEDPAQEPGEAARQYDDWLWALVHGLDQSFLTGRDQDEDGWRDITIPEIQARFDNRSNGSSSDEERWGIPITATQVITFAYDHEDYFVHVMLTETQKILSDTFTAYQGQGADAPSLLFAQEAQYRSVNLSDHNQVAQDGNLLRIELDPEAVQLHTRTFLSWAPYRFNQDQEQWENYPIDEYMDKLDVRLKDALDEYQDHADYENILRGQITLAQSYYLSFFSGAMQVVQIGDTLTGNYGAENSDGGMADWIGGTDISKSGGVIARQVYTFANTIAKISKYFKNIEQLFIDLNVTWQGGFKTSLSSLWQNANWKKLKLGVGIVGATIALGALIAALALYGQGKGRAALLVLDAVMASLAILDVIFTTRSIIKAIQASSMAGKLARIQDAMKLKGLKYSGKAFGIGILIAAGIMLAVFLIAWGISGERWDSLAFTLGLASVLASILTMVILMAIAAIPIVGQIIATVVFLLDTVFQIVCHARDENDESFFCQGLSGYISQGIRWTIFNQNIMVNLDDDKRVQVKNTEQVFEDLERGMAQGNTLIISADVQQHIRGLTYDDVKANWMAVLYLWQFSDENTKSATFVDHFDPGPVDYHSGLDRGDIAKQWDANGNYFDFVQSISQEIPLDTSGINQPARLYLNDAYAVPAQECWLFPNPFVLIGLGPPAIPVCYVRTERGTVHVNLGKDLFYDIFPATFDEFVALTAQDGGYALAWSQDTSPTFGRLQDADGDGLRNKLDGGADPNDLLWDSDGDGLSDFFELDLGSDPLDSDSDDDGLDDYQEVLLETNLNLADSDYDGLTDQEEITGWEFVYDFAPDGSQLSTWVTSDPLSIDGDGDSFSDFQEKTYGFHPGVPSDPNILTLTSEINESLSPYLLLRLDETFSSSAQLFVDDSGRANDAACQGDHCPVAGHYGQYGNAPLFDGSNDYLEVRHHDSLSSGTELTLAAWVYLSNPGADQKIVGKTTTGDGYLLGVGQGQLYPEVWDSQGVRYSASWGNIPADTWTHLAFTWQSSGDLIGYINGVEVGRVAASAHPVGVNSQPLRIGIAPWNASSYPVNGQIDEVLFFDRALSQAEIQVQAAGRYNPADLSVKPGDELFYEATIKNELFNRYAQGLLSTDFPAAFGDLTPQDFVLNPQERAVLSGTITVGNSPSGVYTLTEEADALITDWREDSNYAELLYHFSDADNLLADSSGSQPSHDGSCSTGHCPLLAAGRYGNGAAFDGDDFVTADEVVTNLDIPALTFGGWAWPESGQSGIGTLMAFHAASYANRNMLRYDYNTGQFIYYDNQTGSVRTATNFTAGQWYHVMVVIHEGESNNGYLYVNGIEEARFSTGVRPESDGRFSLGQDWDGSTATDFFVGLLDEGVIYPRALSEHQVQEHFDNPIFHMPFDEGVNATRFEDLSGFGNDGTCQGAACPQSGQAGISLQAAKFDGNDHVSVPADTALDLSASPFTLSAWVYADGTPGSSDCPFRAEYFTNRQLFTSEETVRRCEAYPLNHDWGEGRWGGGHAYYYANYFSVRWTGTFFFVEGEHTFTFTTDDGMRAWLDGVSLLDEWHTQSETTYTENRYVSAGWHTVTVEYFEETGSAVAKASWTPGPLPHPQGILGSETYPALQRVGSYLRLVLNPDTAFLTGQPVLTPNTWQHVAAVFDGVTWFLYVDGIEVDQFNANGQTPLSGSAFEIGRTNRVAQLDLQAISVLDTGDPGLGGDWEMELRLQLQTDGGNWNTVWSHDELDDGDYPVNVQATYQDQANIRIYESDEGEYSNCGIGSCSDDPQDEQMGTTSIDATSLSPYETSTRFESNRSDKVDLLWYSQIDSLPFTGKLDEVSIYKKALSPGEVDDLYDAGTLVLDLPLDDAPGSSDFIDALGQHNGSCSGDSCPLAGVPGREQMALWFDGSDDVVTINNANTAELDRITLAAWVRFDNLPAGEMRLLTVGDDKAVLRYQNGDLFFSVRTAVGAFYELQANAALQTGRWYYLVGTYDGSALLLFLDGVEVDSRALFNLDLAGGDTIWLSQASAPLDGAMDSVRVYRRSLSSTEIQELYQSAPQMLLLLDEVGQATSFEDATGNGHTGICSDTSCPQTGAKGQIGLAALFDGINDHIDVPHSTALNPGEALTLIAWVKLEDTDPDQKLVGKSTTHDGYILGVEDGELYIEVWDSSGTRYEGRWGQITAGYWTQLALTWESSGDLVGYINGNEVGRIPASSNPIGANTSPLRLGIAPWNGSSFPANGRLDQVTLYTRALSPLEMRALFRLQAKWVEERQHTEILVDNDQPQTVLVSDEIYRSNQEVVLLVTASDPSTFVTLVEMGVSTDDGVTYSWSSIPACVDSPEGNAWCPIFEPTLGEGRYLLQFRATDNVGQRETPARTYEILVDGTPPDVSGALLEEAQLVRAYAQPDNTWLVHLSGTVSDPAIAGSPGSGVADMVVKLTDTDPITDTLPLLKPEISAGTWQIDYPLIAPDPTGTYTLSVSSMDQMGNATELVSLLTLGIDTSAPQASLDDPTATTGITGTITNTLTLTGQITETGVISVGIAGARLSILPAALESISNTVAIFNFEEVAGATSFYNATGLADAGCEPPACPLAGHPGMWGGALNFNLGGNYTQADDYISADGITAAFSQTHALSFGGWVYPDYNPDNRALLAFNSADGGLRNQIVHNDYSLRYLDGDVDINIGYLWENWGFVMVTIDAQGNGIAYLNGEERATFTTSVKPDPDGRFSVGQEWDGDVPSQFFNGLIDEVRVYNRALAPNEVYGLYADTITADSGSGVLATTWAYTLPDTLDGLYQINLRPADMYSNTAPSAQWPIWNGQIDTQAPRVALSIVEETEKIVDLAGQPIFGIFTTYTCWAQDFNLVIASPDHPEYDFDCPCQAVAPASTVVTSTFYHEVSPWYADVFTDTLRLWEYQETCTVPGVHTHNFMQACDSFGHCQTDVADVEQLVEGLSIAYSAVITPSHQTILTSIGSTNIEGRAFAIDNIKQVNVYDGAALIGTVAVDPFCTSNITQTQWTQSWFATEGTHYLRSMVVPCSGSSVSSLNNQVYVDTSAPLASVFPTSINRDQRLSYGRVMLAGPASDLVSGLAAVEVSIDGSDWAQASFDEDSWRWEWNLAVEPDNASYTVDLRATDQAGWTYLNSQTVIVDLDVPNPVTLTLSSDVTAGGVVTAGLTLRQAPASLTLDWQASEPSSALSHYETLWTVRTTTQTLQIPGLVLPTMPLTTQYLASEAQRVEPQVTSVFADGNRQVDNWGPVYIDTPLTPDYISMVEDGYAGPYHGWMNSGCTDMGVDRRASENAPDGVALDKAQRLYVTWDSAALRIAWVGANWDYSGDLFVYLNDFTDPSVPLTAFNPFTDTAETDIYIPGARAFVWVKDSQHAELYVWNGSGFDSSPLQSDQYHFSAGVQGGLTDLYLPFDLLGIAQPTLTPLTLFAFATDEGQLRLWATQPATNPVNSLQAVETTLYAGAQQILEWIDVYSWPSMGPGICPNNLVGLAVYTDADLRFNLSAQPDGSSYGLRSSDLFWLADELTAMTRTVDLSEQFSFMDIDHAPLGHGDWISYTIQYANHGTYTATGVTVQATALYALQFTTGLTETISIGDLPPGASGSVTFAGQVNTEAGYNNCLAQMGGSEQTCQSYRQWTVMNATVSDSAYGVLGNPLDWLWSDHQVDSQAPRFFGILEPTNFIGTGVNRLAGYAFDVSGVTTITLDVHPPAGESYLVVCPDETPQDGRWSCDWDPGAVSDGDTFQVYLQVQDRYGLTSDWSQAYTFVVDATVPVINLSPETQAYTSTIVNTSAASFSGSASDNHGLDWNEVCLDGVCKSASTLALSAPSRTWVDQPAVPLAIGACGGGELVRTWVVTDSFTLGSVSLGFNSQHPRRDELQVTLTGPDSSVVYVIGPPAGTPSEYANFDLTLADSNVNGVHTVKSDDDILLPYYDRLARPDHPLDVLRNTNSAGTWTLTVCDLNPGEQAGSYHQAALHLVPQIQAVTTADWSFTQTGLEGQDYISHTLVAYAYDLVGNRSAPARLDFWVDNVAPVLTVTTSQSLAVTGASPDPVRLLAGTVSDGSGVKQLYALAVTPDGTRLSLQVGRQDGDWWFEMLPDEPGRYTFWVNAVDLAGNTTSVGPYDVQIVRLLAANDAPTALGASTILTATVLGDASGAYSFNWDFGDGLVVGETLAATSHTYAAVGVYTATVTATRDTLVMTATTQVTVDEVIGGLSVTTDSPTVFPAATLLTATISAGSNVSYAWDFGDGQPSALNTQALASHLYPAGFYTATITATNSVSVITATAQISVFRLELGNDSPTPLGETTTFTTTIDGGEVFTYTWDFGDGRPVVNTTTPAISTTYAAAGQYTATLAADTTIGLITATTPVTISALSVVNDSPTSLGVSTTFTATTYWLSEPVTYNWSFGDGTGFEGSLPVIDHLYPAAGVYTAVVTVTNGILTLTQPSPVVIDEIIAGLVVESDSPTLLGAHTHLTATVTGGTSVLYAWDFGDGSEVLNTVSATVDHLYPVQGSYTVVVTATNSVSILSASMVVNVEQGLSGLALTNDSPTILDQATNLTATLVTGSHHTFTWDFGDGTLLDSGAQASVAHIYSATGIYTAVVTATNSLGSLSASNLITITNEPISGLLVVNDSPTALGQATSLTATVTGGGGIQFSWDFGDGSSILESSAAVVTHTYPADGYYQAWVTATNSFNVVTATTEINIDDLAPVSVIIEPSDGQVISGTVITIRGNAADDLGIAQVEVSTDGGASWQLASGTNTWTYTWTLPSDVNRQARVLLARAFDYAGHFSLSDPVTVIVDTSLPRVLAVWPMAGDSSIPVNAEVVVMFSEAVNPGTLAWTASPDPGGWEFSWSLAGAILTARHADFPSLATIQIAVSVHDSAGNAMAAPYEWSFVTRPGNVYLPIVMR